MGYPAANPCSETIIAKRHQSPGTDQFVHLHSQACALICGGKVIVDHHPAAVGKSIAIVVDIAAHIGAGIKNEEPNLALAGDLPNKGNRVRIERAAIYQTSLIEEPESVSDFFSDL